RACTERHILMDQGHDHVPTPVAAEDLVLGGLHEAEGVEPRIHTSAGHLLAAAVDQVAAVVAEVVDEVITRGRHGAAKPGLCTIGILVAASLRLDVTDGQGCTRRRARAFAELQCHASSLMIVVLRRFAVLSSAASAGPLASSLARGRL